LVASFSRRSRVSVRIASSKGSKPSRSVASFAPVATSDTTGFSIVAASPMSSPMSSTGSGPDVDARDSARDMTRRPVRPARGQPTLVIRAAPST